MTLPRSAVLPVAPGDSVFAALAAAFDDYRRHYGQQSDVRATTAWLTTLVGGGRMRACAAMRDDQFAGFVTSIVMPASQMLGTAVMVRDLWVVPGFRRQGVARLLLTRVLEDASAAGALRVALQTEEDNLAAIALYRSLEFEPVTGLASLTRPVRPSPEN